MNGIINSSLEDTLKGSALWHGLVSRSTVDFIGHGRCGRGEGGLVSSHLMLRVGWKRRLQA